MVWTCAVFLGNSGVYVVVRSNYAYSRRNAIVTNYRTKLLFWTTPVQPCMMTDSVCFGLVKFNSIWWFVAKDYFYCKSPGLVSINSIFSFLSCRQSQLKPLVRSISQLSMAPFWMLEWAKLSLDSFYRFFWPRFFKCSRFYHPWYNLASPSSWTLWDSSGSPSCTFSSELSAQASSSRSTSKLLLAQTFKFKNANTIELVFNWYRQLDENF